MIKQAISEEYLIQNLTDADLKAVVQCTGVTDAGEDVKESPAPREAYELGEIFNPERSSKRK